MNHPFNKKVAFLDMDGTIIMGQVQQGLMQFFRSRGELGWFYMLKVNFLFILYKLGISRSVDGLFEYGLRYVAGRSVKEIDALIANYMDIVFRTRIFPNAIKLIDDLKRDEYSIVILSTAINAVVSMVAAYLKIDDFISTNLEVREGIYTGKINGRVVYGDIKRQMLQKYVSDNGYIMSGVVAYADHESDIPMLKSAGKGFVVNPNKRMWHLARKEGLGIIYTR